MLALRAIRHALLLAAALTGCNAVLGIEEAELDTRPITPSPTPTTTTTAPVGGRAYCHDSSQECGDCLEACEPGLALCLADQSCRYALDIYSWCLTSSCDDSANSCIEALQGNPASAGLAACMQTSCLNECANQIAASSCEIYCQCMPDLCNDELGKALNASGSESCMDYCERLDPRLRDCRVGHCLLVDETKPGTEIHCSHASGTFEACKPPPSAPCTDGGEAGDPCDDQRKCCKRLTCRDGVCG